MRPSSPPCRAMGRGMRRIAAACSLFCGAMASHAMDLQQAYVAAQRNDATILAARASAAVDREYLPQAKAQMLPSVSAGWSRTYNRLTSVTPTFGGREQTNYSEYPSSTQSLTVRQPLYRPQLMAQYRIAQGQLADAEAELQQEEQSLFVRVSTAYFDALLAREQLALVLAQQAAYTTQLDVARKAFAAGSGIRTDIDEAQARLDMNLAQETEARQFVSYTLQQLQVLVVEPIGVLASLNIGALVLQPPDPNNLEEWQARAEQHSPQLQSLTARIAIARNEVDRAGAGHRPTLDLVAQWSKDQSASVTNTSSSYTNRSLGLQLNIPLYAGGGVNSQQAQALSRQERAEQLLEAGRRDLLIRVYKEFRGVGETILRIKALEQALRSADQLVLSSRRSFQAGSRTLVDILNAEQQRVSVQRDLAQARYLYLVSRVRLLSLSGQMSQDAVLEINAVLQP